MLAKLFLWFHDTINLPCSTDPDFDLDLLRDGWSPEWSTDPQDSQDSKDFQDSKDSYFEIRDAFESIFENDTPNSFKKGQ